MQLGLEIFQQIFQVKMFEKDTVEILIGVCGWLYFLIWSVSFYPQVILLFRSKSAMGMSSNYILINLTGYVMYTVYNVYGYLKGDNEETGQVDSSDMLFSMHSVLVYGVTVGLYFYYPHKMQLNPLTKLYLLLQWTVFLGFGYYTLTTSQSISLSLLGVQYDLRYIQTLGYFKMFSTLLKHPTQLYYNFTRKSTKGWSIEGMIMDFLGGFFSLIALILELYLNPTLHINKTKLFLSVMSMIYDATYMIQHFLLYGNKTIQCNNPQKQKTSPRLSLNQYEKDQEENILNKTPKLVTP